MTRYTIPEGKITFRHDLIEQNTVIVGDRKFAFASMPEAELFRETAEFFGPGEYLLPDTAEEAERTLKGWLEHKRELDSWFHEKADERAGDEALIEKVVQELWAIYRDYRRGLRPAPASKKSPVRKISVPPAGNGEPGVVVVKAPDTIETMAS